MFGNEVKSLLRPIFYGIVVIIMAALMVFGMNLGMKKLLSDELSSVQEASVRAKEAMAAADASENAELKAEAMRLKAEQMETFYQNYKSRQYYHYFGQFYELFENVYDANVFLLGTSHCCHGVNPLYIEDDNPDYSFFNFALNGATPSYYEEWYDVMKNEAKYPVPDIIIYCVDWFMCDSDWLWRRISFDEPADMALGLMRELKAADSSANDTDVLSESAGDEAPVTNTSKPLMQLIAESKWWDVDELLTVFFNNIPIFSSRDRIPEMIAHLFGLDKVGQNETAAQSAADTSEDAAKEVKIELPVYEHEYLRDDAGDITSLYYKGYIPWDVPYQGQTDVIINSNDNEEEWEIFYGLLDRFKADGIKVIFVQIPEYSGRRSQSMVKNNLRLEEIAAEYGIPFLNYNDGDASEIADDIECYSDWGHMNLKGSTLFSEMLGPDLVSVLASLND